MRRIFAQARKELTQLVRDRLAVVLALLLPVDFAAAADHGHFADREGSPHHRAGPRSVAGFAETWSTRFASR